MRVAADLNPMDQGSPTVILQAMGRRQQVGNRRRVARLDQMDSHCLAR